MAVEIKGATVKWGIPSALKTSSDALVTGIVQSIDIQVGGSTEDIADEDGDLVARVGHGDKNTVTISTIVTASTVTLPAKDTLVEFASAVDGVPLQTGKAYIEDAKITYSGNSTTAVDFTIHHYPNFA